MRTAPPPSPVRDLRPGRGRPPQAASGRDLPWAFLNLFLVVAWFVAVAAFFQIQLGISVVGRVASLGLLVYPVLLVLAVLTYERAEGEKVPLNRGYVLAFGALLLFMLLNGFAHGNALRVMYFDLITFVTIGSAFVLGRHDRVWFDIRPLVTVLTAVSIVLALVFTDAEVLRDRSILNLQAGSHFESVLTLVPVLAMIAVYDRARLKWYFVLLCLSAGCVLTYLYFGRRGISVRAILELLIAAVVLPLLLRRAVIAIGSVSLAVVFLIGLLAYFPFDVLTERFQGRYGVVTTVIYDNERWDEITQMAGELSPLEYVIGRGLGGAFLPNAITSFATDDIEGEQFGRLYPHVGAAMPFLKGGMVAMLVYFMPFFLLFRALGRWRALDWITLSAALAGIVMIGFHLIEGTSTYSTPWIGFGVGLIASRSQNAELALARAGARRAPLP